MQGHLSELLNGFSFTIVVLAASNIFLVAALAYKCKDGPAVYILARFMACEAARTGRKPLSCFEEVSLSMLINITFLLHEPKKVRWTVCDAKELDGV